MNLDDLIRPLCAEFKPGDPLSADWLREFVGANVLGLSKIIFPGEKVQCLMHDAVFRDPDSKQEYILDYVPIQGGEPQYGLQKLEGKVDEHFFIIRPFVIRHVEEKIGIAHDRLCTEVLVNLWSHIGRSFRWALQRKYGRAIIWVPFSALTARGVHIDTVRRMQSVCMSVCEGDGLEPEERLAYMDRSAIEVLVSHMAIVEAFATREASKPISLEAIAGAVTLNVPKSA